MSIQGNINQITSLTALLATQTPSLKAMGEKKQQLRQLAKQEKVLAKREKLSQKQGPADPRLIQGLTEEQAELAKEKYQIDPTETTYAEKAKAVEKKEQVEQAAQNIKHEQWLNEPSEIDPTKTNREIEEYQEHIERMAEADDDIETWETSTKAEQKAQEADAHALEAQNAKRATIQRKKGLVKQSYGRSGLAAGRDGRVKFSLDKGGNK